VPEDREDEAQENRLLKILRVSYKSQVAREREALKDPVRALDGIERV
jgi:hypothetical protein